MGLAKRVVKSKDCPLVVKKNNFENGICLVFDNYLRKDFGGSLFLLKE